MELPTATKSQGGSSPPTRGGFAARLYRDGGKLVAASRQRGATAEQDDGLLSARPAKVRPGYEIGRLKGRVGSRPAAQAPTVADGARGRAGS